MDKNNALKLIIFFSFLGIAAFILTAFSGSLVWLKTDQSCMSDSDIYVYHGVESSGQVGNEIIDSFVQCAKSHSGLRSVLIHLSLSSAFIAIVFFVIILVCAFNYRF